MEFANVSEREALSPELAVSTVIFALRDELEGGGPTGRKSLWLPLVRRTRQPFRGQWALPGGPLNARQTLQDAAASNLRATTGLAPSHLEQLYAFGGLDRSPAHRVVSIVYWALVREEGGSASEPDAAAEAPGLRASGTRLVEDPNVAWFPARDDSVTDALAFDHADIVRYALWRLRNKVEYGSIAHRFLGERFTLAQVQEVYEAVLGRRLDAANFRRHLRGTADIEPTDEYLLGGKHRPPRLYRYTGDTAVVPDPTSSTTASTAPRTAPPTSIPTTAPTTEEQRTTS